MVLSSVATLIPAVLVGIAIDELTQNGFSSTFIILSTGVIGAGIVFYVITFLGLYSFMTIAFRFERDIRQEFFDKIQSHSLTFHDENNSSHLLSMGMTEISQMRQGIMPGLRGILQNLFSVIIMIITIYAIAGREMALATLAGFILYYYFALYQARKINPIRMELANTAGEMTEQSQEIFRGIEVVRSFRGELREFLRFKTISEKYSRLGIKEGQIAAFYLPDLILLLLTAILFGVSLFQVTEGTMTVGTMIQILGLLITLQLSSMMLPQMFLFLNAAITNANRLWEKMHWQDPQPDKEVEIIPQINWESYIVFENVTFYYTGSERPALANISLIIPKKSKIAIIGGPGSGKSTFLKLLLQLYLPQEGRILIDGVDYTDIPASEVRKHVSRVEQEIFLFSGTIRENISFANPDATEEEIIRAATAAQAMEFIEKLPQGLDTVIGERGVDLSGGQRQRLAIARAILANPDILLLDDSASALDSKTEELLRKALDNLSADRLTIVVTQRLRTLLDADKIIIFKKGRVLDYGNHRELIGRCAEYQRIFELLPETEKALAKGGIV